MALTLASSFAFETCDVLCRTAHSRAFPEPDASYRPKVSFTSRPTTSRPTC